MATFTEVISLQELVEKQKTIVTVEERIIALFYVKGSVFALDHFCYHAGGPLAAGDIEDVAGRTCVACPWHRHQITLDTGESLYTSVDPANPKKKKHGCSKGVKQRTHFVKVERGFVYIQLSDLAHKVDSDVYFSAQFKEMREATLKEPILQVRPPKMKVPIHSYRPPPRS